MFWSSAAAELKKLRRRCPETMRCTYFYALSSGVDKQFRHIHVAEADHFKQFVRLIARRYRHLNTTAAAAARNLIRQEPEI